MPRHSTEFGSALPSVAELTTTPVEKVKRTTLPREQASVEKAQLMWDVYQDIKGGWIEFVRSHRTEGRKRDIDAILDESSSDDEPEEVSARINLLQTVLPRLRDNDNPLSQEFRATSQFQKLHARLTELWNNDVVKETWRKQMQQSADQWADVNGSWDMYVGIKDTIDTLEVEYGTLQKEKFEERGKSVKSRRRTLQDDIVDVELTLATERIKVEALFKQKPELAAKILASEFKARHKEWQKDRFMWSPSRRVLLERLKSIVNEQETLRLIVLEGEAGSGKTTFVDALAKDFTDENALRTTVKKRMKADRALFAEQTLEAGSSPTEYKIILQAVTGKLRPTDGELEYPNGRVGFLDEFNNLENDEAGEVVATLDGIRVGGETRYAGQGANPDDKAKTDGLIVAAQNPAGARFKGRTDFTPEVKRKMTVVEVPYPPQTAEDPELYEDFLVVLKNADGSVMADPSELAPDWTDPKTKTDGSKQAELKKGLTEGGALWRLAQMLHESYENLATRPDRPRKNVLTDETPDALFAGRVLPPGDIFGWLEEYKQQVKKHTSLENFLSEKLLEWLDSQFGSAGDSNDRQLYLHLAEKFKLLAKDAGTGTYKSLPAKKISPSILTDRQVAELSPRVPRPIIVEHAKPPAAAEWPKIKIDFETSAGRKYKGVDVRIEELSLAEQYTRSGQETPVFKVVGMIKECSKHRELVGQTVLAEVGRPEKKLVLANLVGFEKKVPEFGEFSFNEQEAKRLGLESIHLESFPEADSLIDRLFLKPNEKGFIDIANPAGQDKFCEEWNKFLPTIPPPCVPRETVWRKMNIFRRVTYPSNITATDGHFWYLNQLKANKIITNLVDKQKPDGTALPNQTAESHFGEAEFLLVDSWEEKNYDVPDAVSAHTSSLLREFLGGTGSTVNIKRETLDAALWDGDPVDRKPTAKHKEILMRLGCDPNNYEFRCISQDEYARGSVAKDWGKKELWTNFDHYFLGGVDRDGLAGGCRSNGGAADVDYYWRVNVLSPILPSVSSSRASVRFGIGFGVGWLG